MKGGTVYGLRSIAGGKTRRVLPGLNPRDAEKILVVLKTFGADVPDDPVLPRKLKEDSSREGRCESIGQAAAVGLWTNGK